MLLYLHSVSSDKTFSRLCYCMSHNWFNFKEKQNCNVGFLVKGIVTVVCFSKIILLHYELVSKFASEEYLLLLNMQFHMISLL